MANWLSHLIWDEEDVGSSPVYATKRLRSSVGLEHLTFNEGVTGSSPVGDTNTMLGFLVVTVLTMVSKLQDSSNKRKMDSPRLKYQ